METGIRECHLTELWPDFVADDGLVEPELVEEDIEKDSGAGHASASQVTHNLPKQLFEWVSNTVPDQESSSQLHFNSDTPQLPNIPL